MYLLVSVTTTTTTSSGSSTASSVSATSLMFQLVIGLAVVLAIIWVISRVMRGRVGMVNSRRRSATLAVIGRQPLGKGVQIAIVKAGTEMYLLGVTAHQVTRLARFDPGPDELVEASSDDLPSAGAGAPPAFRLQSTIRQLQERTLRRTPPKGIS